MDKLRTMAAALTVVIGCAVFFAAVGVDYPLADGDGGFVTPGIVLAVIFGGAPIITGLDILKGRRDRGSDVKSCAAEGLSKERHHETTMPRVGLGDVPHVERMANPHDERKLASDLRHGDPGGSIVRDCHISSADERIAGRSVINNDGGPLVL